MSKVVVSFRHLPQCEGIVEGRDGDVAAVNDLCPLGVRIDAGPWVEASEAGLACTGSSNSARSKTSAGAVGHCSVEWRSENGDIILLLWVLQASCARKVSKG